MSVLLAAFPEVHHFYAPTLIPPDGLGFRGLRCTRVRRCGRPGAWSALPAMAGPTTFLLWLSSSFGVHMNTTTGMNSLFEKTRQTRNKASHADTEPSCAALLQSVSRCSRRCTQVQYSLSGQNSATASEASTLVGCIRILLLV